MKKILLLFIAGGTSLGLMAQLNVSKDPSDRNVLLEDFTGIHCGYCPDGAKVADEFKEDNPGRVVVVGNHAGGYATPSSGDVDFRTEIGEVIDDAASPTGYPSGAINRTTDNNTGNPGNAGRGRGSWVSVGEDIMDESSPVNLVADAYFRPGSDEIVIHIAGYYTEDGDGSDYLTVAILQDEIPGAQAGASTFYPERINDDGVYVHMDVLRGYVTDDGEEGGDEISTTSKGTEFTKDYTYTAEAVHFDANEDDDVEPVIENMKVVIFMSDEDGFSDVITAIEVEVAERAVGVNEIATLNNVKVYPNPFETNAVVDFNLQQNELLEVNVFDVTGKVVYSIPSTTYKVGNNRINIDGTNLQAGMYYMNIVSSEGVMTKKLVLNK